MNTENARDYKTGYTMEQFDDAAARLLGEDLHRSFRAAGLNRPTLCEQVAKLWFIGEMKGVVSEPDLAVIRWTATNLWARTGDCNFLPER